MRARQIANGYLEKLGHAIGVPEVESVLALSMVPYRRLSQTHDALIENEEQARIDVTAFLESIRSLGVDLAHRRIKTARSLGARYVEFIHVTHLLKDATPMITPFETRLVLLRKEDDWKVIELEWNVPTIGWKADIRATPAGGRPSLSFGQEDIRGYGLEPMATYQAHLDAIAKTEEDDDFETYCSFLRFPHTAHSMQMDNVIEGPDDVRPFFEMIKKTRNGEVADHLERTCDWAEFLGSDLLVGYHTARAYKNGVEVIEPVTSRMVLQLTGDRWQLLSVANSIRNKQYPFDMYSPGEKLLTDLDIQKRTIKWPNFLRKRTTVA